MTPLFKKLNLADHRTILVRNAPDKFEHELDALDGITIKRQFRSSTTLGFFLFFVQPQAEVDKAAATLQKVDGDPVAWLAYPKRTSKNFQCEFNRDNGFASLGDIGFEGVRQVAIDEDWSALRFRRVEHIQTLKRDSSRAISKQGKLRTGQQKPK